MFGRSRKFLRVTIGSLVHFLLLGWMCSSCPAINVFVNGDFQSGSLAPSTSAYTQSSTMGPAATWNIVAYDTIHPAWVDFYDHTIGNSNGRFMVVNGTTTGGGPSWAQAVTLSPNTYYQFTIWLASLYPPGPPASLEFRVKNGAATLASAYTLAPGPVGQWFYRNMTFYTGAATSLSFQIWDVTDASSGNDYALDDLSLAPISNGDYNGDGKVDASDYITWRKTSGATNDYNVWRANYGAGSGSGSSIGQTGAAVPEPTTISLLLWYLSVAVAIGINRRSRNLKIILAGIAVRPAS
jgi:hypothetical protein